METKSDKDHDLLIKLGVKIDLLCKTITKQGIRFDKNIEDLNDKIDDQKDLCMLKSTDYNNFANTRPSMKTVLTIISPLVGIIFACMIGLYSYTNEVSATMIKHDLKIEQLIDK